MRLISCGEYIFRSGKVNKFLEEWSAIPWHCRRAFENDTFIDAEAWRSHGALDNGRGMGHNFFAGKNITHDGARNNDDGRVNLGVHFGAFADDEDVIGEDFTFKFSGDANCSFESEFSFELCSLI